MRRFTERIDILAMIDERRWGSERYRFDVCRDEARSNTLNMVRLEGRPQRSGDASWHLQHPRSCS